MNWSIQWTRPASRDLSRLDRQTADRIVTAVTRLAETGQGDVQRLRGQGGELRLRVGDWRVRFVRDPATRTLIVYRVLPRGRAYRD